MKKEEMQRKVKEMIDDSLREGKLTKSADILTQLPDLLESVDIDIRYILKCYENELKKKTGNPINAFLGLMGIRIVNTNNTVRELGNDLIEGDADSDISRSFLKINEAKLKTALDHLTGALATVESAEAADYNERVNSQNEAIRELDRVSAELHQLNVEYDSTIDAMAQRVQYMLSLSGEDTAADPMAQQAMELLNDLDMTVYWKADDAPFSESQLFSVYKSSDPGARKKKPAVVKGDKVVAKGVIFIAASKDA